MITEAAPRPITVTITRENAREVLMDAVVKFKNPQSGEIERESMLEILRNNDCRDILATCVNEEAVIEAFIVAIYKNDVELLQAFHDIGMNVDVQDRYGDSALRSASGWGKTECVRWLLDHGANVDIQDNYGSTPLTCACIKGEIAIAEMLLQKNANPDIQTDSGHTALMCASANKRIEIVQLLLTYNASTELRNNKGMIALDMARNEEIKEMLMNHVNTSYVLK